MCARQPRTQTHAKICGGLDPLTASDSGRRVGLRCWLIFRCVGSADGAILAHLDSRGWTNQFRTFNFIDEPSYQDNVTAGVIWTLGKLFKSLDPRLRWSQTRYPSPLTGAGPAPWLVPEVDSWIAHVQQVCCPGPKRCPGRVLRHSPSPRSDPTPNCLSSPNLNRDLTLKTPPGRNNFPSPRSDSSPQSQAQGCTSVLALLRTADPRAWCAAAALCAARHARCANTHL